jgi:hypothetical protein
MSLSMKKPPSENVRSPPKETSSANNDAISALGTWRVSFGLVLSLWGCGWTLDAFSRAPLSMTENSSFEMALQMPS